MSAKGNIPSVCTGQDEAEKTRARSKFSVIQLDARHCSSTLPTT